MANPAYATTSTAPHAPLAGESAASGVSWAAIVAGALAATATTVTLTLLGSGIGLTTLSPWSGGPDAGTFAISAAVWLVVTQWLSAGLGGYLAGRLRTKWTDVRSDEVFFRDTAHGFLAWALATVLVAFLLASATTSLVSGSLRAAGSLVGSATQGAAQGAAQQSGSVTDPTGYFVDSLFRTTTPQPGSEQDVRGETTRILVSGIANGDVPAADRTYLAQLVSARTGLAQPEAEKRVNDVIAQAQAAKDKAKAAADAARKAAATVAIFTVLSMAVGAFIASVAAALGGRLRDDADLIAR